MILVAAALALGGALCVVVLRAAPAAFRAGPWPGLTPRGAAMLLGHALLLAAGVLLAEQLAPRIVWLCALSVAPLVLVIFVVRMPGAASAVCGAYLLPRSLLNLLDPTVPLPPPLLVAALLFDVLVWLRLADLRFAWPWRRQLGQRRSRVDRSLNPWRVGLAALGYCAVLALLQPAFDALSVLP